MNQEYVPVCYYSEWSDVSGKLGADTVSLLTVNARGLTGKCERFNWKVW